MKFKSIITSITILIGSLGIADEVYVKENLFDNRVIFFEVKCDTNERIKELADIIKNPDATFSDKEAAFKRLMQSTEFQVRLVP